MQNAVERWLTHGSYKFKQVQMDGSFFCSVIRHLGGFGNPVHVFEPVDQPGVIIVGSKVPLKSMQNFRYLKFNGAIYASFTAPKKLSAIYLIFFVQNNVCAYDDFAIFCVDFVHSTYAVAKICNLVLDFFLLIFVEF